MKEYSIREMLHGNIPAESGKIEQLHTGQKGHPWCHYAGQSAGQYASAQTRVILEIIAMTLFYNFPDRKDRQLSIGDGCRSDGRTCPGHSAHAGGWRIDMNYYTFAENNWTHYVPSWGGKKTVFDKGWKRNANMVMMWDKPLDGRGLQSEVFDWERNFLFWMRLTDVLPKSEILVSSGIYSFVRARMKERQKYRHYWSRYELCVKDTGRTTYHHQFHAHLDVGTASHPVGLEVDWDKKFDWLRCGCV